MAAAQRVSMYIRMNAFFRGFTTGEAFCGSHL
jgi:hypothetical protein